MCLSSPWFINSLYLAHVLTLQSTNALRSFSRSPGPLLPAFPPGPHVCSCSCSHRSLYPAGFLLLRRRQSPELLTVRLSLRSVILRGSADLSFSDVGVCLHVTPSHTCVCACVCVHTCVHVCVWPAGRICQISLRIVLALPYNPAFFCLLYGVFLHVCHLLQSLSPQRRPYSCLWPPHPRRLVQPRVGAR